MKVGDWVIEDLVSYGFFAYEIANIFMSLIVVIWMVVKIWKEMKERFIDVLRMVQYWLILTWFLYVTYFVIFNFWDEHNGNMVKILDGIMDGVLIYYYIFNLTTWYLLMYQIKVLKLLRNGIEYKNANKQTKSHEIKIITLLALFICIYSILNVSLSVFSSSISLLQNNQRLISLLKYTLFYFALLILNLILFIKLSVIMKDNLNYYFLNNWKNIRFIFHLTSAFYAVFILLNLFEIIFDLDDNKIERDPLFSNELIRIFCLIIYIFLNVLRLLYYLLSNWSQNMQNIINFKRYFYIKYNKHISKLIAQFRLLVLPVCFFHLDSACWHRCWFFVAFVLKKTALVNEEKGLFLACL